MSGRCGGGGGRGGKKEERGKTGERESHARIDNYSHHIHHIF